MENKKSKNGFYGRVMPEGWEVKKIGSQINLLSGYAFSSEKYTNEEGSIKLLRGDNVGQGFIVWENAKFWDRNEMKYLDKYQLELGDLVIAMDRTLVSNGIKVSEVKAIDLPCLLVQRVCRLRVKQGLCQIFLIHLFSSKKGSSSQGVDGMFQIVEPDESFGKEVVVLEFSGETERLSDKSGNPTS